jgi:hypothetical protein
MGSAVTLYRSLGFRPIAPYYSSPIPDTLFMEARLSVCDVREVS